jgi:hypothetical protein
MISLKKPFYALLLLAFCPFILRGQNSSEVRRLNLGFQKMTAGNLPFDFPLVGGFNCPQFSEADLNNDGKADLFVFDRIGGAIACFLNENNRWVYRPEFNELFPRLNDWALLRDFNGDGITDIFTYNDQAIAGARVFRGKWQNGRIAFDRLNFAALGNVLSYPLSNGSRTQVYMNSVDIPVFDDIDGDTDLDVLAFEVGGGHAYYYRNQSIERGFRRDSLIFTLEDDCWGRFLDNGFNRFVKLGSPSTCAQNLRDGGVSSSVRHPGASLCTFDADNDGDRDLLIGSVSFENLSFLTNAGTRTSAYISTQNNNYPANTEGVNIPVFPAAYLADVDFDGRRDLLVSPSATNFIENYQVSWLYKNTGTQTVPSFQFQQKDFLVRDMLDFGAGANPAFIDVNADGLQDLVVGNISYFLPNNGRDARLFYFQNVGTAATPIYRLVDDNWLNFKAYSNLDVNNYSPTFGDMDGDGDLDLIVGEDTGTLFYVENRAGAGRPLSMANPIQVWKNIEAGASPKPQIVDLDRDGLPDLVSGTRNGFIRYFRNTGTRTNPNFTATATIAKLGAVDAGEFGFPTGFAAPQFVNMGGRYLLFCGTEFGKIKVYDRIDGRLNDTFRLLSDNYGQLRDGVKLNPAIANINGDTRLEMVVGNLRGGLTAYQLSYHVDGTTPIQAIENQFAVRVYPNPASAFLSVEVTTATTEMADFDLQVYNALGQVMRSDKSVFITPHKPLLLEIGSYTEGVYFLELRKRNGQKQVLKFLKTP